MNGPSELTLEEKSRLMACSPKSPSKTKAQKKFTARMKLALKDQELWDRRLEQEV